MKMYFGVNSIYEPEILGYLSEMRKDIGFCVSAFYIKEMGQTRGVVVKLREMGIPCIIDNGAFQTYKLGTQPISHAELREYHDLLKPDFMIAPDVMADPTASKQSLINYMKDNNDLELMAPLHSINFQSAEAIEQEIGELKDVGYHKFGLAKAWLTGEARGESFTRYVPFLRKRVDYLHYLSFPLAKFGGDFMSHLSKLDSADLGIHFLIKVFRFSINHTRESADMLNALMNVLDVVERLPHDVTESMENKTITQVKGRSLASVYR